MSSLTRSAVALVGVLVLVLAAACDGSDDAPSGGGKSGTSVALAPNTCWTAQTLGADPQAVLELARSQAVDYFSVAHAVDGRPAFQLTEACDGPHHVEVYQVVPIEKVKPVVTGYAAFLQFSTGAYRKLSAAVERACMNKTLAETAERSGVPGAVAEPAFPAGAELGWAPPSPEQWAKGQRVYACTLSSAEPVDFRYAAVFTQGFPTDRRTCISNSPLQFVDCARKHNRESIAVINVRTAVAAKKFPGRSAITAGPNGRFVDLSRPTLARLDRACTAFLGAVSTTTKLTGVANIDPELWPTPEGDYPITCQADTAPTKDSVVTEGSVFDK